MRERESWTKTERSSRRICYAWGMSELSNSNQTLLLLQLISQNFLLDTSSNQWQVACCLALAWEWDDNSQNVAFITQTHLADMKTSCGHIKAIKIWSAAYWISPLGNIRLRWNLGHICKASLYTEMLCWSLLCTCLFSCHRLIIIIIIIIIIITIIIITIIIIIIIILKCQKQALHSLKRCQHTSVTTILPRNMITNSVLRLTAAS